ncbi:type II/IV secretion system ATPase subunit [Thermoplasma sp.]|uniref:type II/IV secretion system ATPase subunit n=1 Tax=Thermoplasma sp. TaxID=1973142 RepID=UPI0012878BD7|nr:type II/IV secretion system ATPase subunit [Thermoplasma sp.]KAA8923147.1 MAG: type II/IV secretion system ATPase subunit [Thermoplasma sp.]
MSIYEVKNKYPDDAVILALRYLGTAHEITLDEFAVQNGIDAITKSQIERFVDDYVNRMGKIQPLVDDPDIEDITILPENYVYIYHRTLGSVRTDIFFTEYEAGRFARHLAQRSGKTLSVYNPIVDISQGNLRINLVHHDVSKPTISIRKLRSNPFNPANLIGNGTVSPEIMAYLWEAIQARLNILITGSTASGKTTFLNAIAMFIDPLINVVLVEDTHELYLEGKNILLMQPKPNVNGLSMQDLLDVISYRNPEYLIAGEIRGSDIGAFFNYLASGRKGITTVHSGGPASLIRRLRSPPNSIPDSSLMNVDIIVEMKNDLRRHVGKVSEVRMEDGILINNVYEYSNGGYEESGVSYAVKKIAGLRSMPEAHVEESIRKKRDFLAGLDARIGSTDFLISLSEFKAD